ncbi:MAG: serine protease [Phycisphaerae bacterium]
MAAAIGRCAAAMNRTSSCTSWWLTACFVVGAWLQRPAPAAAQDMDYRTLERVKRATVMVFTAASQRKKADKPLGSGSGYFINGTGLLITNNHVVDPAHQMSQREKLEFKAKTGRLSYFVITESGTDAEKSWECELVSQSEAADQALLQAYHRKDTKLTTPDYLRFLPDSKLRKRLKVWVLGFPGGDSQRTQSDRHAEISVSSGMVTDVPRTPAGRVRDVVTDLLARPGNSGGPVVQIDGFVVGTVTLMTQTKERADTSKLVPADLAHQLVRNAYDQGRVAEGSDFTPFTAFLTDGEGRISVPGFKRLEDRDVLFTEAGDRIYGRVADEKIRWESPLGSLEIGGRCLHGSQRGGLKSLSRGRRSSGRFTPRLDVRVHRRRREPGRADL